MVPTVKQEHFSTSDIFDNLWPDVQVCRPIFKNYGGNNYFAGPIQTLKVFEDFSLIKKMVNSSGNGHVLVIDGGGSTRCAMLGDQLAKQAIKNGWAGILINGCLRDSLTLAQLSISVKAINTSPVKPTSLGGGQANIKVNFADVMFKPGYIIYSDFDGILLTKKPSI